MKTKSPANNRGFNKKSNGHLTNDSKKTVADLITDLIIEKLEAGVVPWRKPWNGSNNVPKNIFTLKNYRGVNAFILGCCDHALPYFATFNQVVDHKGTIRKSAKSIPICFYSMKETEDRVTGEDVVIPILRYYRVFNISDIEGIPVPVMEEVTRDFNPIEEAERIVAGMPCRPDIKHVQAKAFYSPSLDYINMPETKLFHSDEEYYSTLFHELTHSTGHQSRLNRASVVKTAHFGSSEYSKEELIAEMGASFLSAEAGIINATIDNSASYIRGWISALKSQDNKGLVITAASAAQKATDYILRTPAYTEA